MKAKLEFNLPEDQEEFDQAVNAGKMYSVLFDLKYNMRKRVEAQIEFKEDDVSPYDAIQIFYDNLYEEMETHGLVLE